MAVNGAGIMGGEAVHGIGRAPLRNQRLHAFQAVVGGTYPGFDTQLLCQTQMSAAGQFGAGGDLPGLSAPRIFLLCGCVHRPLQTLLNRRLPIVPMKSR